MTEQQTLDFSEFHIAVSVAALFNIESRCELIVGPTIGETLASTDEQAENLDRLTSKLSLAVLTFCQGVGIGGQFFAEDLREAVAAEFRVAPDSPVRVLRDLRKKNQLDYTIINRRRSLYEITKL